MPYLAVRADEARKIITEYTETIDSRYTDAQIIEFVTNSLEEKLQTIERYTLFAFDRLGYKTGTLEERERELSQRIKELQQDVSNLNGQSLYNTFIQGLENAYAYTMKDQKHFEVIVNYAIDTFDKEFLKQLSKKGDDVATAVINTILPSNKPYEVRITSGSKRSGMAYTPAGRAKNIGNFGKVFSELGPTLRKAVEDFVKEKQKKEGSQVESEWDNIEKNYDDGTIMSMRLLLKQADVFSLLKMAKQDRDTLMKYYPDIVENVNKKVTKMIVDGSSISGRNKKYLKMAIERVLAKNDLAFWVAGNNKDMTGILGEIQALFYILALTKGSQDASWIGGLGKVNPHADVLLQTALGKVGIQVKNTTYERAEQEIEFQSFGTKSRNKHTAFWHDKTRNYTRFFENTKGADAAYGALGLDSEMIDAIQQALIMKTFNVEYQWHTENQTGEKAVAEPNPKWSSDRRVIEQYYEKVQKLMAAYSAAMMYMQTDDFVKDEDSSNTLYIVAGTLVISTASILKQIITEIKGELHSFKFEARTSKEGEDKTIVYYLNNKTKDLRKNRTFDIKYTSSYNFTL